jgi:HEAT repeat protein
MRHLRALGLLILLAVFGCGRSPATLAGGKPVAHWVEALHDRDVKLRKKAAFKLGNVGPADPAALPALVGALDDPDPAVRSEVILALIKFGSAARDTLPRLTEMQRRDRNALVRQYAARAAERLQME